MKTIAIIPQIIMPVIFLFVIHVFANAQVTIISKSLTVTVYATEKYEASKQSLYDLLDSCRCKILSINETKTENGNQKAVIELVANDNCFKIIDKKLPSLGYISFKNLKTEDKSAMLDTTKIREEIDFYKERKIKYVQQLAKLKTGSEQYTDIWTESDKMETLIYDKEKSLVLAKSELAAPHRMQIVICE